MEKLLKYLSDEWDRKAIGSELSELRMALDLLTWPFRAKRLKQVFRRFAALPRSRKVRIDFILPSKYGDGQPIPEEEITKAMLKISDKYGGSTTLVANGRWIDEKAERKEADVNGFLY